MNRATLLRSGLAVGLGVVVLSATAAQQPDVTIKGQLVVGQHRTKLQAGKLYLVKVEGDGFQPAVRVSPGNFILPRSSEGVFEAFLHPRESRDYRVQVSAHAFDDLGEGQHEFTLKIRPVSLADKPVLMEKAQLTDADPLTKPNTGLPRDRRVKAFPVKLTAKQVYLMEMAKGPGKVDPYLGLEGPDGNLVGADSDSKPGEWARLYFQPRRSGDYRILATSYSPGLGEFTLRVVTEGAASAPAAGNVIAEAGFNDAAGINSDTTADSPYPLAAPGKQGGAGEPGWASPWEPAAREGVFQKKTVFEGDGALYLSNTGLTRHLSEAQQGRFAVEQHVQLPKGGRVQAYLSNAAGFRREGPVWAVMNGTCLAFHGDGKGSGKFLETPFRSEPGKWHKVTVTVDVPARRWEFSVDGRKFEPPQPLAFRSNEDRLSAVRYQSESQEGAYIDAVRLLRDEGGARKK